MGAMKRYLAWPIALPLAVIGTLAAHSLGYRAAVPDAHAREHLLAASGHGYLQHAPLVVGVATAAALLGFFAAVLSSFLRRPTRAVQVKLVAGIPPLAFVVQEFVERALHDGRVQPELILSAPFLFGLAAQLPFALLAAAIAYALTTMARRLGAAIAARRRRPTRAPALTPPCATIVLPPASVLSRGYTGRGPPLARAH
jgi:hypothetical protein